MNNFNIVNCPHCFNPIIIYNSDLNCKIFRHAIYKNNFTPVNPHASKELCLHLINNNLIYGCGKPFQIITLPNNSLSAVICDYI